MIRWVAWVEEWQVLRNQAGEIYVVHALNPERTEMIGEEYRYEVGESYSSARLVYLIYPQKRRYLNANQDEGETPYARCWYTRTPWMGLRSPLPSKGQSQAERLELPSLQPDRVTFALGPLLSGPLPPFLLVEALQRNNPHQVENELALPRRA